MNPIWFRSAAWLGGAAVVSLIVWPLAGLAWALAFLLLAALVQLAYHLGHIDRLFHWARSPDGTPVPDGGGVWGHIYSAFHRRSRLAAQDRLQLSRALERQREAIQAMPDGVVILQGANLIESINSVAEQQFGVEGRRDIGLPFANLVRQPDFVALLELGESAAPRVIPAPGMPGHTLSVQLVPFGDDHRLVLARDVTHVERLETMRRDFIANVSHEMRTPLTVIHGYLEMLGDEPQAIGSDDAQRFVAAAREQSARLQNLVADLLTLSSLETGSPVPNEEIVNVKTLLETVQREIETLSAGQHEIRIESGPPASILGRARELHSAFSNLAINAVRYTPPGGIIRLVWQVADGQGLLSVEDNGIGIEARHIPRLTERFYRVDRGRSRESGGTGLGLAIVKHVLERHQAKLEVESSPGQGSRFSIRLPERRVVRIEAANAA